MADAGKMEHLIGIGDNFGTRVKSSGVKLPAAENIAEGQKSVDAAVTAWINSPKHLHNMLGKYDGLGVALAYTPLPAAGLIGPWYSPRTEERPTGDGSTSTRRQSPAL